MVPVKSPTVDSGYERALFIVMWCLRAYLCVLGTSQPSNTCHMRNHLCAVSFEYISFGFADSFSVQLFFLIYIDHCFSFVSQLCFLIILLFFFSF